MNVNRDQKDKIKLKMIINGWGREGISRELQYNIIHYTAPTFDSVGLISNMKDGERE